MSVKSTYNFVPAPKESEVYKPEWSNQVSHDKPFSDGESGEISFKIIAQTPIFIRNGHSEGEEENEFSHAIINREKKYFIPATSMKGMVRNVLEIMSRSRMTQVNNHGHSVRQIMRTEGVVVDEGYTLANDKSNIYAGWLVKKGENFYIYNCGKPYKIRYTDIDSMLFTDFDGQFGEEMKSGMDTNFSARTGKYKYETLIKTKKLEREFEVHPLNETRGQSSWKSKFQSLNYVRSGTDFKGTIVCVGQASGYSVSTARKGEYVFKGVKEDVIANNKLRHKIDKKVMNDFLFINRNNEADELEDWGYWKNQIEKGIPVFFRKKSDKTVKDFGLTFMYKEPAEFSVKELSPINTYEDKDKRDYKPDLAETIFGYTTKENSLKGRVFFSNSLLDGNANFLNEKKIILSNPKSTYFPYYLKQNGNGKTSVFQTYNKGSSVLSGFKRYPIRNDVKPIVIDESKKKLISKFVPMVKDSVFVGKIRFHNLKKAEIGSIISSLSFHGTNGDFFHSLGYAKSFGYGRVKITIDTSKLRHSNDQYLKYFEYEMRKKIPNWHSQINELLYTVALPKDAQKNLLSIFDNIADFQSVKNTGEFLQPYSHYTESKYFFKIHQTEEERKEWLRVEKEEEDIIKDALKKERKENERLAFELAKSKDSMEVWAKFISDYADSEFCIIAKQLYQDLNDKIELEAFNKAIQSNNMDLLEEYKINYPSSSNIERVNQQILEIGLKEKERIEASLLNEDFTTNSFNFDDIKKWPLTKKKLFDKKTKRYTFSENQKKQIIDAIKRSFILEKEKKDKENAFYKKGKRYAKISEFPWTDIVKWIGKDKVSELYNEIFSKKTK